MNDKPRILIVDDDPVCNQLLRKTLQGTYDIYTATIGDIHQQSFRSSVQSRHVFCLCCGTE